MKDNIIRPQFGPKLPITTDEYFGGCPKCGKTNGYVDVGADHWFACDAHRTRWYAGSNLFSSWRNEKTPEEIASNAKVMAYRVVEPVRMPTEPATEADPAHRIGAVGEFSQWLADMVAAEDGEEFAEGHDLPRRFTVRHSTPQEADGFAGRRGPNDQAVTIIDPTGGDEIYVVALADAVVEDTDKCGWTLLREQQK